MTTPQVTLAPCCPVCGSLDCATCRSKGIEIEHRGKRCRAQKQYRRCRDCGETFGVIHVRDEVERPGRRAAQ